MIDLGMAAVSDAKGSTMIDRLFGDAGRPLSFRGIDEKRESHPPTFPETGENAELVGS